MREFWLALCLALPGAAAAQERTLDDFERPLAWKTVLSDGVKGGVQAAPGKQGQGLRFDYDFGGGAGYAAARRALPLGFDGNFEISFWIRAEAPLNNFELKLVDASGDNVWWVSRPNFAIGPEWRKVTFKKRHISFAWGPAKDQALRHTEHLELVVSAGRDGGRGTLFIDDLSMRPLPPPAAAPPAPWRGDAGAGWTSEAGGEQQLTIDFGQPREFGGLQIDWGAGAAATRFDVQLSDDGRSWRTVRRVLDGAGGASALMLAEAEARYLRLALHGGQAGRYRIEKIDIKPLEYGASANAFFQALATTAPAGHYPRGMSGQQNYWTVLGVDGGRETGLLSEDGALEVARGGFTVEPFVLAGGKLASWADVVVAQSLRDGYLPIPSVTWTAPAWRLRTTAFARGTAADSQLVAQYELANTSALPQALRLVLAARPFQVNPPMQFLNTPPGVSEIRAIATDGASFDVDGKRRVHALHRADAAGVSSFDAGMIPAQLAGEGWRARREVSDEFGFASGALAYDFQLAPGAVATVGIVVPLNGAMAAPQLGGQAAAAWLQGAQDEVAAAWRSRLNQVALTVPPQGQRVADTLRSSLAHMLMTRDGPSLMPGTRSYARSWIRDGAMMSEAMLRLGNDTVARDYARWYAGFQFASGKVPCCVDRRGADPVPENDSQGEFVFLVAQLWRYTHDRALVEQLWPRVAAAAAFMEQQRQSERGPANRTADRRHMFGLLPASISHEGYSAKPMHAYWDDFWGLRGYRDAAMLAAALGKHAEAKALRAQGDQFQRELLASLRMTARVHKVGYLAGAAELGDFDPTSTTIALSPGGLQAQLPQDLLLGTFERYWTESVARRSGKREWKDYTPYELRNVAAFVRLGWRQRAHEILDFFMNDRRPAAWNQWAEVVGRLPREPRFVGDMPHGWISSDYIRSALDLFAYERETDHALIVADGIPLDWLDGEGVAVVGLRTSYGQIGYRMRASGGKVTLDIARAALPPGGIVLRAADPRWPSNRTLVNGRPARWAGSELRIKALPAQVTIFPAPATTRARP